METKRTLQKATWNMFAPGASRTPVCTHHQVWIGGLPAAPPNVEMNKIRGTGSLWLSLRAN